MPELPEVETVLRGLVPVMEGRVIQRVVVNRFDLRIPVTENIESQLTGAVCRSLFRRGKYVIAEFDRANPLIWHLGMSGRVRIYDAAEKYYPERHDHVQISMSGGVSVIFHDPRRFGSFYLSTSKDWTKDSAFSEMGPEPLDKNWGASQLQSKLSGKKSPIKTALLDQSVVAGLGNIYVCEALYMSRIAPDRASGDIHHSELDMLVKNIKIVLENAIEAGGSTLKDHMKTDGTLGYFQNQFNVYGREGEHCQRAACHGSVNRIVQAGRSTFFCPVCQS